MKILIADDEVVSLKLLESRLRKWGYEVVATRDGSAAWAVLTGEGPPGLAILDWQMPGIDGLELCRRIRQVAREPYVYVILLTAKNRSEDIVAGLEAGADDYMAKPFDAHELQVRLRAGRRIIELCEQLVAAREAMSEKASRDWLTGLWNRGAIMDALGSELARAGREDKPLGILMGDIDHFKRVNDTYGHMAGDAVLRETARRILGARRAYDSVGRYGGEEMLILAPGCDLPGAGGLAERLRAVVNAKSFDTPDGLIQITMSFGATAYEPGSSADADALVRAADRALYQAKNGGRNRVASVRAATLGCAP
jgi:two-component system cell cycle response regulator